MLATPDEQIAAEVRYAYRERAAARRARAVRRGAAQGDRGSRDSDARLLGALPRRALAADALAARARRAVPRRARSPTAARRGCSATSTRRVSWRDGVLNVGGSCEGELDLDERGLLLMPSVFVWPKVTALTVEPWQPTLVYPARGIGMLWSPERIERPGRARAARRAHPGGRCSARSTRRARRRNWRAQLGLSAGGVSQHLGVLRDAGLVCGRRVARSVLYLRSAEGDALVEASGGPRSRAPLSAA